MLKISAIGLLAAIGIVSFAQNASASIPRYRAPGARVTPIQNALYTSPSSPMPGISFANNGVLGAEVRFVSGSSLAGINVPPLNTAFNGGFKRHLVVSFACAGVSESAIEMGVGKMVVPSASINNWVDIGAMNASTPRQAYNGWYILYTTHGTQYLYSLQGIPTPSPGAGVWQTARAYRTANNGWNLTIWDASIAQNVLNTNLGPASCQNLSGQPYTPNFVHAAWAGSTIDSSDPAFTPSSTVDGSFYRFENLGFISAGNTYNYTLPNAFGSHNAPTWLGASLVGYRYNPPAANNAVNRLLGGVILPNPNITPIPVPVAPPAPCPPPGFGGCPSNGAF